MVNPSEVFSIMLIIGGDIVQKAIAQMAGKRVTLVAFSFGWVAYAFNGLMSAFGDGSLMPDPDFSSSVIAVRTGNKKSNNSWVLCRLIRDLEQEVENDFQRWYEQAEGELPESSRLIDTEDPKVKCTIVDEGDTGLVVTMCKVSPSILDSWFILELMISLEILTILKALGDGGIPDQHQNVVLYSLTVVVQLVLAMIPTILYGNWSVLLMTFSGTVLAALTASLKEWRLEKYKARRGAKGLIAITRGNGHKHVFVIQNGKHGDSKHINLEDLAGAVRKADHVTRTKSVILAVTWVFFLLLAGGLSDHTWFLLAVGLCGMAHNVYVAGRHVNSANHGIPVQVNKSFGKRMRNSLDTIQFFAENNRFRDLKATSHLAMADNVFESWFGKRTMPDRKVFETSKRPRVMEVLQAVEREYTGVGLALLGEFFPSARLDDDADREFWEKARAKLQEETQNKT